MKRVKTVIRVLIGAALLNLPIASAVAGDNTRLLKEELFKTAEDYIRSHKPWKDSEISVKRDYVLDLKVPADSDIRLEAADMQYSKPWGKLLIPVLVFKNNTEWRRVQVYLKVDMVGTVALAIANIRHRQPLTIENVKFVRIPLAKVPHTTILEPAGLENMQSKGTIRAGTIITSTMVERIPDVRKGDQVRLKYTSKGFMVTALGQAREDGFRGEYIKVVNLQSNKSLIGLIKDKGIVEIKK